MPDWNLADLYPGPESPRLQGRSRRGRRRGAVAIKQRYQASSPSCRRRRGGAGWPRPSRAYESAERHHRPASAPTPACSTPPTRPIPSAPSSMATSRRSSPPSRPSCCSSSSSSTGSTTPLLETRAGQVRLWRATGRGSTTCARRSPTSSTSKLERLFHEKSITARGAWNRLFNETMTALRFEVEGERAAALEPTLNLLLRSRRTQAPARRPRRWPRSSRRTCASSR